MKRGDFAKIARHTGLSRSYISQYFKGIKGAKPETIFKIQKAIDELEISLDSFYLPEEVVEFGKKINEQELHNRYDIYNNLPYGAIKLLAEETYTSSATVTDILMGKRPDRYQIIEKAELIAAINIWKTRFCKYESKL
jgi:AraC-like DNA-binding protein